MKETRQQLRARLEARGVWGDFVTLRDRLVKEGRSPRQAKAEALREIESRPVADKADAALPTSSTASSGNNLDLDDSLDFDREVSNFHAAQWVAHNIANRKVKAADAPSGLAWGLLKWVRQNPANEAHFWGSIWPKLLPTGAALKDQQVKDWDKSQPCPTCGCEPDLDTERCIENIRKWLKANGVERSE